MAEATKARPVPRPPQQNALATRYRKGEIWMVASDPECPPVGTEIWSDRPAVVVSADRINDRSGFACVVYLTRSARKRTTPTHVTIPSPDAPGTTMALCEQVHTVDASRLRRRMGAVPAEAVREIDAAIAFALSLGRNPDTYGLFKKWEAHVKVHGADLRAEVEALTRRTSDERVEALQRALTLMTEQRDSYQRLAETQGALPQALAEVAALVEDGQGRDDDGAAARHAACTPEFCDHCEFPASRCLCAGECTGGRS